QIDMGAATALNVRLPQPPPALPPPPPGGQGRPPILPRRESLLGLAGRRAAAGGRVQGWAGEPGGIAPAPQPVRIHPRADHPSPRDRLPARSHEDTARPLPWHG